MKKQLLLILLFSVALLVPGCTGPQAGQNSTAPAAVVQYGDLVSVDYTLRVDGKVVDTSLADVARQSGTFVAARNYQPLSFRAVLGGGMINGFVNGIVGMGQGETKSFTVSPADGYGSSDPSKVINQSRYYNMSVFEDAPVEYFTSQNITLEKGRMFQTTVGYVGVDSFDNDTVRLRYIFSPGHQFAAGGLPQTVVNMTNETMLIRFDVEQGGSYIVRDASTGANVTAIATYVDNETMVMDENYPLAGKTLDFEVTVRSIVH